ncbi:efflux RND transporter periplasmic adaptor subunit [Microbispora cellulosiformans]|uniref:Efflux RND transporter periplasmic adaptor subunit n=1 Tax=Microbispora cellulosiformans TaxID=2614688 RepID=A0A5J5JWE3_9ACTN|nr:efflux RND transporter periplasmic adaptor subunit [Microbispora cellulosiformans]KAA9374425.1 efflux RND transporter periplasmic adaptor subunit [Microbispora cellulosiformans]
MRSSAPYRVGGLALAGIVIASVAVISATGDDSSDTGRMSLASVRRGTVTAYVSAAGNTVDTGVRDLAFGAEGVVEKVYVKVGEKVRRGKVLARIDDTIAREDYEAAKAALAAARETLDDVKNGTSVSSSAAVSSSGAGSAPSDSSGTGGGAGTGAAGSTAGAPSGRSRSGTAGSSTTSAGTTGAGTTGAGTTSTGTTGAGTTGAGTIGAGAGSAGPGGSGGGQTTCPTPSPRPSAHPTTQPSARPSAGPPSGTRAQAASSRAVDQLPAPATALLAAYAPTGGGTSTVLAISPGSAHTARTEIHASNGTAGTASAMLAVYRGGEHGGSGPKPGPTPASSPNRHPHPHPHPTGTHRPNPGHDGRTAPDPEVSISIPPTAPPGQSPGQPSGTPSATPSPSPGRPSGTCTPDQGGKGQNPQGQGGRGQGSQGHAGFGGGQAGQGGQGGRGGQTGQGGARLTEAQAEAQVSQATTELAEAKEALAGIRIKAPADGTVLSISGDTGAHYTSGAFVTLGDLDNLQVQALFTESDIRFLKTGQAAVVTLPTQPGREYAGTVAHIDPTATTSNRLVRYGVRIDLASRPARLLLGQSATVKVTTDEAADALYVPSQAVRVQGDGTAVVTVTDGGGAQVRRPVEVGVRGDTSVEVVTGLSEGDQVVLPTTTTAFPDEGFPAPH